EGTFAQALYWVAASIDPGGAMACTRPSHLDHNYQKRSRVMSKGRVKRVAVISAAWALYLASFCVATVNAQRAPILARPIPTQSAPTPPTSAVTQPASPQTLEAWRAQMARVPLRKKKGCFRATYPRAKWHKVRCTTAPSHPDLPGNLPGPGPVHGPGPF